MFHVNNKRSLSVGGTGSSEMQLKQRQRTSNALQGCVICLTGLSIDQKNKLHSLVENLGGRYTGDLDTSQTTHLISQAAKGAKYETALACSRISIVTPIWLIDTFKAGKRLNETDYTVVADYADVPHHSDQPLICTLDSLLACPARKRVFLPCKFLLIGFEEHLDECRKLEKIIERGRGLIFRDVNEIITHLIVRDKCDKVLINAAKTVSMHHPCEPPFLSPRWIVKSFQADKLLSTASPDYLPRSPVQIQSSLDNRVATEKESRKQTNIKDKSSHRLFRSCIFSLVRLSPPSGAVDFDTNEITDEIFKNGGQILSNKVLAALRVDQRASSTSKRICYVICWGGFSSTHLSIHNLLSQVKKENLCQIVPVTPIWLKASIKEGKLLGISRNPTLFQPQSWPYMKLIKKMKIAVTGFLGSERSSLILLIRAMGADYTESMKPSNTHLICREAKGAKYEKGLEWDLKVVSIDWLYHVMQYGFGGVTDAENGCEERFSLPTNVASISEMKDK